MTWRRLRSRPRFWAEVAAVLAIKLLLTGALLSAWWLQPLPAPSFETVRDGWRSSDAMLLDRHGAVLGRRRVDAGVRRGRWLPLTQVSPAFLDAVVQGEDRRFRSHHGIDWRGVAAALRDRLQGRGSRGASTVTMQLATLLQAGAPAGGDWARKRRQMRLARGLERSWNKDQILEAYVNLLPFRGELQGIDAAARRLAGKQATGLDNADSALLAALLPAPAASPTRVAQRACARQERAPQPVACELLAARATAWLAPRAPAQSLPVAQGEDLAPHLAVRLLGNSAAVAVRSTLDARVQALARDALAQQLRGLADRNVRDGAALVVDNDTGEVLAYVGSAGPASRAPQVDGIQARRQAGSTLKPFLYGLALERRYLTAASLIDDAPLDIDTATGRYLPQNYDGQHRGLTSLRNALAASLNVPAVRTLMLVGVEPFGERLRQLGYAGLRADASHYGYALALGAADVSLWEQALAYRTLARQGRRGLLRVSTVGPPVSEAGAMDPAAAFIVADILSDRAARATAFGLDNALATPYWSAAKTGTSKDMRDNWCLGFSSRFTVAVWVGNFEGDPMHDVSGVTGAAPAWRQIMDGLHQGVSSYRPQPPSGLVAREIHYAAAREPSRREWFLAGTAPSRPIEGVAAVQRAVRWRSPSEGLVIALDPDIPPLQQRLPLLLEGDPQGLRLRVDGVEAPGTGLPEWWVPLPGTHKLELVDEAGTVRDSATVTVR